MSKLPIAIVLPIIFSFTLSSIVWAEDTQTELELQSIKKSLEGIENEIGAQKSSPPLPIAQALPITQINPNDYNDKAVINEKGDEIGEVKKLVTKTDDRQAYAIVSMGGFMGIGSRKVAISLENLQPNEGKLLLSSAIDENELKNRMEYEESDFSAFELNNPR